MAARPSIHQRSSSRKRRLHRRFRPTGRLVGLDALDWSLVDDLTARGAMPNLRALLARGSQAVLEVPRPLISPVVWTTIATGVTPDVHGVLDFLEPDPDGGAPHPVTAASRRELAEAVRLAPDDEALRRQLDALGGPPLS